MYYQNFRSYSLGSVAINWICLGANKTVYFLAQNVLPITVTFSDSRLQKRCDCGQISCFCQKVQIHFLCYSHKAVVVLPKRLEPQQEGELQDFFFVFLFPFFSFKLEFYGKKTEWNEKSCNKKREKIQEKNTILCMKLILKTVSLFLLKLIMLTLMKIVNKCMLFATLL